MVDSGRSQDGPPTSTLPCDDFAEDLAAYSWGALDAAERARLEHHRAHCSGCDRWLRDSAHALAQLDEALPRIPPPPELRGRVLASIDGIVQSVQLEADIQSRRADGSVRLARSPVPEAPTPGRAHSSDPGRHIRPPQARGELACTDLPGRSHDRAGWRTRGGRRDRDVRASAAGPEWPHATPVGVWFVGLRPAAAARLSAGWRRSHTRRLDCWRCDRLPHPLPHPPGAG